jgi:hypothetical protein
MFCLIWSSYSSLLWFPHIGYNFFQPFTFSFCVSLVMRCVSCRQQIVRSCLLIQSDNLCILMGELNAFTFRVMIERYWFLCSYCFFSRLSHMLIVMYFWLCSSLILLIYWVEHAFYFPSSHGFINSFCEFYSFLMSCVWDCF